MKGRLDPQDVEPIIDEAVELEEADRARVDREVVREALREVDVAPERLEEAEARVAARRVAAQKRKRTILAVAAAVVVAGAGTAAVVAGMSAHSAALAGITATDATVHGLEAARPVATFEANLRDAPMGSQVDLQCEWSDPSGHVVHENHWKTKPIDRGVFPTHCKFELPSGPSGYTVTLRQGQKTLAVTRLP